LALTYKQLAWDAQLSGKRVNGYVDFGSEIDWND